MGPYLALAGDVPTDDVYTCEECSGTFTKGWSDDEADAEAAANPGSTPRCARTALVCDECYRKLLMRMIKERTGRPN